MTYFQCDLCLKLSLNSVPCWNVPTLCVMLIVIEIKIICQTICHVVVNTFFFMYLSHDTNLYEREYGLPSQSYMKKTSVCINALVTSMLIANDS